MSLKRQRTSVFCLFFYYICRVVKNNKKRTQVFIRCVKKKLRNNYVDKDISGKSESKRN